MAPGVEFRLLVPDHAGQAILFHLGDGEAQLRGRALSRVLAGHAKRGVMGRRQAGQVVNGSPIIGVRARVISKRSVKPGRISDGVCVGNGGNLSSVVSAGLDFPVDFR